MATYSLHVLVVDCVVEDVKILELIVKSDHHYVDRVTSSEILKVMKHNFYKFSRETPQGSLMRLRRSSSRRLGSERAMMARPKRRLKS
ncbi:hypothetical protein AGMMS50222_09000 [Endomicrobiia bacterium]|nr:hypothetical protein AGMMS50222_09000 [Endomicrobiia bacterium]